MKYDMHHPTPRGRSQLVQVLAAAGEDVCPRPRSRGLSKAARSPASASLVNVAAAIFSRKLIADLTNLSCFSQTDVRGEPLFKLPRLRNARTYQDIEASHKFVDIGGCSGKRCRIR